jgi:hypothetical protein
LVPVPLIPVPRPTGNAAQGPVVPVFVLANLLADKPGSISRIRTSVTGHPLTILILLRDAKRHRLDDKKIK